MAMRAEATRVLNMSGILNPCLCPVKVMRIVTYGVSGTYAILTTHAGVAQLVERLLLGIN